MTAYYIMQRVLTRPLNQSAERMAKESILKKLTHWISEFLLSGIVVAVGAALLVFLPEGKQGIITTPVYSGSAGWAVVIIGCLGLANSVRRGIFKKKTT